MKRLLILTTHLLFCALLFAQTDNPGCNLYASVSDIDCLPNLTCSFTTGYTSTSFTVVCKGWYTLMAWTDNTGASCAHCASCVAIYQNGQQVAWHSSGSVCDDGNGNCCERLSVQLTPGNYELRASLRACQQIDVDACCREFQYHAFGSVTSGIVNCP